MTIRCREKDVDLVRVSICVVSHLSRRLAFKKIHKCKRMAGIFVKCVEAK